MLANIMVTFAVDKTMGFVLNSSLSLYFPFLVYTDYSIQNRHHYPLRCLEKRPLDCIGNTSERPLKITFDKKYDI